MCPDAAIGRGTARAYTVPTDAREADGRFAWDRTTLVVVEVAAGGETGLGYTYADACLVRLIEKTLGPVIAGANAMDMRAAWTAIDVALWDLKAKLLGVPLASLFGQARASVSIYGSGGFTSYDDAQLRDQLAGWVERDGCRAVKMKIGTHTDQDPHRVAIAKKAIGDAALFVDANGAFGVREALRVARIFADSAEIRWFEE